jgi:hypothetical protein
MRRTMFKQWPLLAALFVCGLGAVTQAADANPTPYWNVRDIRPGMKGVGRTVMVGTTLEEFQVEVLGVMTDVSPGRDMILCRLSGCNLEHAGIIQGMSGSPIYIDGKLVGAVAFAWEFAKDPIAGVTPYAQMVQYVRANERRLAAEAKGRGAAAVRTARLDAAELDRDAPLAPIVPGGGAGGAASMVSGGGLAGMRPIATPLAATGFSARALALLESQLGPIGLAPTAGGGALKEIVEREGNKPLVPGSPLSVAMVTGDFDLSGIGTVTHVEGERVYAFGHPMMGLGPCQLPMMTGYIHTVYPRASVSMKMGSPLKVVGVLDTDVSTAVSGRLGAVPDMLPVTVRVKANDYSEPRDYHVQVAREPNLMATLVMTVLASAIDTEGNLPEELTARLEAEIQVEGYPPLVIREALSGPRYSGPMGPMALFSSVVNTVHLLLRNPLAPFRIESIDCRITLEPRRTQADIESVRLATDRVLAGQDLNAVVTVKPFKGPRQVYPVRIRVPADLPEGTYELSIVDLGRSLQKRFRSTPGLLEPKTPADLIELLRLKNEPTRTALYAHIPLPARGLTVKGQALPDLPSSVRSVLASPRETPDPPVRNELIHSQETPWVLDGVQTVSFTVVRDRDVTPLAAAAGR